MTTAYEPILWYGIVVGESRNHHGGVRLSTPSGDQFLTAVDPTYLLTRMQITSAYLWDTSIGDYLRIGRPLSFNEFKSDRNGRRYLQGNREPGMTFFAKNLDTASFWSAAQIVDYLRLRHYRTLSDLANSFIGSDGPILSVDMRVADFSVGEIRTDGQTFYDVLQQLFNRRRALAWWIEPRGDESGFNIVVDTMAHAGVFLPGDDEGFWPIEENDNKLVIDMHDAREGGGMVEVTDEGSRYQQVTVTGGRQGAVFSLSMSDDTLEPDWTGDDEDAYLLGAKGDAGYATKEPSEQMKLNDSVRSSLALRHVFTRFRMPLDWNGKSGNGTGGPKSLCFPELKGVSPESPPEGVAVSSPIWMHGLKLLQYTPLIEGKDYTSTQPQDNNLTGSLTPFREPIVALKRPNWENTDQWFLADSARSAIGEDDLLFVHGNDISATLKVHDHQAGVTVTPRGLPHVMQDDYDFFFDLDPLVGVSNVGQGSTRYQDMIVTVYGQCDELISYTKPATVTPSSVHNATHRLFIRLGDRARFDMLVPNTVVDVSRGNLIRSNPNQIMIRDDRLLLRYVANEAWHWYQSPRRAIRLLINDLRPDIHVGYIVSRIQVASPTVLGFGNGNALGLGGGGVLSLSGGDRTVNSVVTSVTHQIEQGRTEVVTQFAELDFEELLA